MPSPEANENIEITVSKPQTRFRHLSTENEEKNEENEEKIKENEEKIKENEEKLKENGKNSPNPEEKPQKTEEPYFIETRFCTVCYLEQPLRAKHCRECGKCVALHDHHCPWLGICIGEKNRFYFWWYLFFECILLWTSAVCVVLSFENVNGWKWLKYNGLRLGILIVLGFFILMVTCLFGYHSYLAIVNQTTWENVSWEKISYLKRIPKKQGSPFSKGILFNLWFYCWKKLPVNYTNWYIPRIDI